MRILFVCMPNSVHAARWISQLQGTDWDIHVFPVWNAPPHDLLAGIPVHAPAAPRVLRRAPALLAALLRGGWPAASQVMNQAFHADASHLAAVIRDIRPDVIHSHEFQHSAYLTLTARSLLGDRFPVWVASNWGSDVFFFGRLEEHRHRIQSVLEGCDFYHAECARDVALARKLGLRAPAFPVIPIGGGFDLAHARRLRSPGPTSSRRTIAVKGYQTWAGRSTVALAALRRVAHLLDGYTVEVFAANSDDVRLASLLFGADTGIPTKVLPFSSHEEILRVHGRARISLGLSLSDAISTSFLEALVMGSYPVQSSTGCANEWAEDGVGASFVPAEDPAAVAAALERALTDDALVDRAAEVNARTADERLARDDLVAQTRAAYEPVRDAVRARASR